MARVVHFPDDSDEQFDCANGFDDEDGPEFEFDCGMDIQGNCGKAGSEECDWECPYRDVKRN